MEDEMSGISVAPGVAERARPMTKEERKVIVASSAGTIFEWYDFYLYGSLAATIGAQFFSSFPEATRSFTDHAIPPSDAERYMVVATQGRGDEAALRTWVNYLASLPENATFTAGPAKPLSVVLRRLTHNQYNNTVAGLLGDRTRPANRFPPEDFVHGFTNQADGQNISPLMAEDYARAAAKLARECGENVGKAMVG